LFAAALIPGFNCTSTEGLILVVSESTLIDDHSMATSLELGSKPREGWGAESPGSYAPALRLVRSRLDPGDDVEGDVFITGYGQIETAKLVFYPSSGIFDQKSSSVRFGYE
jgi:hypothetical protein